MTSCEREVSEEREGEGRAYFLTRLNRGIVAAENRWTLRRISSSVIVYEKGRRDVQDSFDFPFDIMSENHSQRYAVRNRQHQSRKATDEGSTNVCILE